MDYVAKFLLASITNAKSNRLENDVRNYEDRIRSGLAALCRLPPVQLDQPLQHISADKVQRLANVLLLLDKQANRKDGDKWFFRPRTFIILFNLDCVHLMQNFADEGRTDFYLPYNNQTLPSFMESDDVRQAFLQVQNYVLTSARELEMWYTDASSTKVFPHVFLDGSGDQHFRRQSLLGQGNFGTVDEVYSCLTFNIYARKRVMRGKSAASRRAQEYLVQELQDLKHLSHRHLVKFLGSYTDKEYIAYLMLPVAEYNLHNFLTKPGGLTDRDRHDLRTFYGCLAGAVNYLHSCKIRHRDLSSRNILIHQGSVFISDFGSAYKWASHANQGSMTQDRHVPASPEYMAPEVAKKMSRSSSSDMWSLGVIFLEMTTLLVGRTLDQLHGMVEKNSRGVEPYIWANPKVVNFWLDELRMSNIGPRHDNEPLAWIQDLLNVLPDSRPKSRSLMLDILDCPSFSIFCCIRCQPEFRERHFEHAELQSVTGDAVEDSTDLMQNIARIFEDDQAPMASITSKKSASIQNWLASSWVPQQMPGGFEVDEDSDSVGSDDDFSECESQSDFVTKNQVPGIAAQPQRPQGPWLSQTTAASTALPVYGAEKFAPPYNIAPPLPRRPSLPREPLPNIKPTLKKDTGLGFVEIESPPSSDDEDMTGFRVIEDSSGTDSDSNDTITPFRVIEDDVEEFHDCSPSKTWTLPKFAGEKNNWVQNLDNLPEEDANLDSPPAAQDKEILKDTIKVNNRTRLTEDDKSQLVAHLESIMTKGQQSKDGAIGLNKTPSEIVPNGSGLESVMEDRPDSISAKQPVKTINNMEASSGPRIKDWRELPVVHVELDISNDNSNVPETSKSVENGPLQQTQERRDSFIAPTEDGKTQQQTGQASLDQDLDIKETIPGVDCSEHAAIDSEPSSEQPFSPPTPPPEFLAPQSKSPSKEQTKVQKTAKTLPPATKGSLKKAGKASVSFTEDTLSNPKRLNRKNLSSVTDSINPDDYIKDTWEAASTVATSVMSDRTSRMLQKVSINRWLDHDYRLLERYCSAGNVGAVRLLLQNGCNPGKPAGSKQGRRRGPLILAIKGASPRHNKVVGELINYDVDINVVGKTDGKTPLHLAIENQPFKGYEHLIRLLLDAGANPNKPDSTGNQPIMKVFHGNDTGPLEDHRRKALALLLSDAATTVGVRLPGTLNTPLHLAVRRKDPFAVGMLLFKKADVNAKNASGSTPLLLTANQFCKSMTRDQKDVLLVLLKTEGILVNEKAGVKEQTALHYAVEAGVPWAVEQLVKYGADLNCTDSKGRSARVLAEGLGEKWSEEERESIMSLLMDKTGT